MSSFYCLEMVAACYHHTAVAAVEASYCYCTLAVGVAVAAVVEVAAVLLLLSSAWISIDR